MKKYVSILVFALMMSACTSATVTVKEGIIVEYGSEVKIEDLVAQEGITLKEVKEYDAKKVGEQTVTAVFDQDGKEITQEVKLEVKDTKSPEIILVKEEVEITAGDEFDIKSNIKAVKDPVDGDIKYSDEKDLKKGGYQITGEVRTDTAGTYEQKVIAYDINGNKSEKTFKVIVKEKEESSDDQQSATNNQSSKTENTNTGTSGGNTEQPNSGISIESAASTDGGETTPAPAPQQPLPTPEPTPEPQPTPEPEPAVLCPNGTYPNKPCDYLITGEGVPGNSGVWTTSEQEAIDACEWGFDRGNKWYRMQSFIGENEYNDGTIYYTVHFY